MHIYKTHSKLNNANKIQYLRQWKLLFCIFLGCQVQMYNCIHYCGYTMLYNINKQIKNFLQVIFIILPFCIGEFNSYLINALTFTLLELHVISRCYQYRVKWVCTSMLSVQDLYCWLTNFKVFFLIFLNMIMDSFKYRRWIIPFKKFSRLVVNIEHSYFWTAHGIDFFTRKKIILS